MYAFALIVGMSVMPLLPASAQEAPQRPNVYLSEINWGGSELSNADEWIELFNRSRESVDLGGWILTGVATSGNALSIEEGTILPPGETLLISNYPLENEKTTLAVEPDLITSSLSLSNSTLNVMLTLPSGFVIDEMTQEEQVGTTNPFVSMTRVASGKWEASLESINLNTSAQRGTPGVHTEGEATQDSPEPILEKTSSPQPESTTHFFTDGVRATCFFETEVFDRQPASPDTTPIPTLPEQQNDAADEIIETEVEIAEEEVAETSTNQTTASQPANEPSVVYSNGEIIINEIVSDPADGTEWVELKNSSDRLISLRDWVIMDASEKPTVLPDIDLNPGELHVVENPAGKLNNGGDTVYLFDPTGSAMDEVVYSKDQIGIPKKGESISLINETWVITDVITRGTENQPSTESGEQNDSYENQTTHQASGSIENEPSTVSHDANGTTETDTSSSDETVHKVIAIANDLNDASEEDSNETEQSDEEKKNSITGMLTALPGTFGSQIAFIDGIQLYFHHADWPKMEIGDIVKVTGERSENRGEQRIKIASADDIQVIDQFDPLATDYSISSLLTLNAGALARVTGTVVERNGDNVTIQDETGEILAVAHKNTGVQFTNLQGSRVSMTGVVRKFNEEVKIYPRSQNDLMVLEEARVEEEGEEVMPVARTNNVLPWLGGGLTLLGLGSVMYWYQRHKSVRFPEIKHAMI